MKNSLTITKWGLFLLISFIWGSSFELMKLGLFENHDLSKPILSSWQVASLRLVSAGLVLVPFVPRYLKKIATADLRYIALSGIIGTLIPAFLFTLAETKIDGAFAGTLNSLTPGFVIIVAAFFFSKKITSQSLRGIIVAFIGSAIVFYFNWSNHGRNSLGNVSFAWFCVLATFFYGLNVNMVDKVMANTHPMAVAVIAFASLVIPAFIALYITGYFSLPLGESKYIIATLASVTLGIIGTTVASLLFYKLMQKAGYLFASMVTYGIPFIAQFWGWINGEKVDIFTLLGLLIILLGIFIATKVRNTVANN